MNDAVSQTFAGYQSAILALAVLTLIVLLQSFVGAYFGFVKGKGTPGVAPAGGHGDIGFRALRCYQNGVENLPAFAVAVFIAVVAGADASLVNNLAIAHVALRVVYAAIYYGGFGKPAAGPRSLVYVVAWGVNIALVIVAILALM